jgi:hypothetical protein
MKMTGRIREYLAASLLVKTKEVEDNNSKAAGIMRTSD